MSSVAKICSVTSCVRRRYAKTFCNAHWRRWKKGADLTTPLVIKHGLTGTPIYRIWSGLRNRCNNPNNQAYKYYGGRGIKVCDGINQSLQHFIDITGDYPGKGYSIDRRDTDGHYSCGECSECIRNGWAKNIRWATASIQSANQRLKSSNHSGVRGVSWSRAHLKWLVSITKDGKAHRLGQFDDIYQAARAYDKAALDLFGAEAKLNNLGLKISKHRRLR